MATRKRQKAGRRGEPIADHPHDALFKATFSQPEHAAGELRTALPAALVARIDWSTLELRPGSFVDEALKERCSDLLFTARLAGRRAYLYLLFEHQSTAEPLMAFRLLRYMVRIWDADLAARSRARRLPAIVPVVLHHAESSWTGATAFEQVLDIDARTLRAMGPHAVRFRFVLDDISAETDEALQARAMTALGRLVLWCFRHAREPEELARRLRSVAELFGEVRRSSSGARAVEAVWRYVLSIDERTHDEVVPELVAALGEETRAEVMSAAQRLIEQGVKQGVQQGMQQGMQQGAERKHREIMLRQLRSRFGQLPQAIEKRVESADAATLDLWTERVLTAASLEEVVGAR